jgi:hypothetical protein
LLGKSQGYFGLPIRDEVVGDVPVMVSAWHPTPKELAAINAGAPVHVCLIGSQHPPIQVSVGDVPA